MLELSKPALPNNSNGYRTTHTCELCGFEPKTKNKYREKQDHMVMKHFKERIDKLFPTVRPYTCPAESCEFLGKDKQALLRHYTGKHGVLEKYLREALAEKGIHYIPGELNKRKSSSSSEPISNNDPKPSKIIKVMNFGTSPTVKSNNEELRREVEAMMASFQPQPLQGTQIVVLPQNTQILPVPLDSNLDSSTLKSKRLAVPAQTSSPPMNILRSLISGQNPASGTQTVIFTSDPNSSTALDSNPMIITSSGLALPQMISTGFSLSTPQMAVFPTLPTEPLPIEMMNGDDINSSKSLVPTSVSSIVSGTLIDGKFVPFTSLSSAANKVENEVIISNIDNETISQDENEDYVSDSPAQVIEESQLMWENNGTEASVIIDGQAFPIKFIEAGEDVESDGIFDTIDYETLMANGVITTTVEGVQERQLDFYML